ncbi:MAG: cytosine deaminase [Elainellaceae cyanobacterium]
MIPNAEHYWLQNAQIPVSLLETEDADILSSAYQHPHAVLLGEYLATVDLEITQGIITQIVGTGSIDAGDRPSVDLRRKQLWPCFVDMHTHLDKGHIWERAPNPDRTFAGALQVVRADSEAYWDAEDVYRRMEFGLKCSYVHGTKAIRTHLDSFGEQAAISFDVFKTLCREWSGRINLQAACLVSLDYYLTADAEILADRVADVGGVLGGVAYMNPELDAQLDRVFTLAKERNLNLDFHADESGDPNDITLRHIAQAALRHQFDGQIVCGHCCSLAVQSPRDVDKTIHLVKDANIGIVSLPLCNLYLQDRNQQASQNFVQSASDSSQPLQTGKMPRWRGVTLLHELSENGIPVAIASDNCRDPFHGFGDHDALEVFNLSARIGHLDAPYGDWPRAITSTPASLMGLPEIGKIGVGRSADFVIFKARGFSELLSRPQSDRTVVRRGTAIDATLPDYEELDDLMAN